MALAMPLLGGCSAESKTPAPHKDAGRFEADGASPGSDGGNVSAAHLPLVLVKDVDLPGGSTRFDYQDVDRELGHLVVSHMNDGSVLFLNLSDGAVLAEVKNIPIARGVVVADDVGLVFVTSSPSSIVIIDNKSMTEKTRVDAGGGPDGVGWDPADKVVGVSDQTDGAISLIPDSGNGTRKEVMLGTETGNVVFDPMRGNFWITVVASMPPDQLVAIDPVSATVKKTIDLPGCTGAHGLRIHPDGKTAFVACEGNATLARVDLDRAKVLGTSPTGAIPDVMSIDPGLAWIYVASESADLTVFDINQPGVALVGHDMPGDASHTVSVDTTTHRVFFPLMAGPNGTPVLRIMKPSGI
jgi:DNA-binding beta-propeller fold protein YncE